MHNFKEADINGWTPGHGYRLKPREPFLSMIEGEVVGISRYQHNYPGRAKGLYIDIQTPERGRQHITLQYGHLASVYPIVGDWVKRGQAVGHGTKHAGHLKLMIFSNEWHDFQEDPDNYGFDYGYPDYLENIDQGRLNDYPISEIEPKRKIQRELYLQLASNLATKTKPTRAVRKVAIHFRGSRKSPNWSLIEKFRFLESMYNVNQQMFPRLSRSEFETIRNEFYSNQPFVLTLPMKKRNP
jgi:hypothetical protein